MMSTSNSTIIPTDEQQDIIQAFARPEPLQVSAYAGTAKTSSIVMAAGQVRAPALALAFNKRIAEEIKPKLPGNWRTLTLNGLGYLAWARALPAQVKIEVDSRKLGRLVRQVAKEGKAELSQDQWQQARQMVSQAQLLGLAPDGEGQALVEDSPEVWEEIALEAGVWSELDRGLMIEIARATLVASIDEAKRGVISFDDQIYCPTILGGKWPLWPVIAVDEAQDLSKLNHAMLRASLRPGGKLITVGDSRQAIYAWRGADADSMNSLQALASGWQTLPLTMTFRCPKRIVARQQHHAPGYRAWSGVAEGRFELWTRSQDEVGGWTWSQVRGLCDGPAAVLCRNNAPLLALAFRLIRQRIAPVMIGRDIGSGLVSLARQITGQGKGKRQVEVLPAELFRGLIDDWEISQRSAALAEGREDRLDSIADRAEALRAVLDGTEARDTSDLITALESLFARAEGDLTLSTIHRAKGLEWDCVVHLDPWRIPARSARQAARDGDPGALQQEWNLQYVAETRTRNVLINASLEDFQ